MPNITIYVQDEVFEKYKKDKNRKGIIAKLVAEHYGFSVNKSRVVVNTSSSRTSKTIPHLAAPLIERYKQA